MIKKIIIIVIIASMALVFACYFDLKEETKRADTSNEKEETVEESKEMKETYTGDPYKEAEEVMPTSARNMAMDKDLRAISKEVFGKEPKLTKTGEREALFYVVNRNITPSDMEIFGGMINEMPEYEVVKERTDECDEYEIKLFAEIEGEKYRNVYIRFFMDEEGERSQRIEVRFL